MKRDLIKIFFDEIYSSLPRKIYPIKKLIFNHIDEIWSFVLADMIDYKVSNNEGFRYEFIIIDNLSKHLWCFPLKSKNKQTITKEFSNLLTKSKRHPLKIESGRGAEFYNNIFQNFYKKKYTTLLSIHRQRLLNC